MEVLSIFKDMTIGNEILCNKLIGDYFAKVKEKYDLEIYGEMVGEKKRLMDLFTKSEIKSPSSG